MSFKTHVQRAEGDIGLQFYVYIAGIPYIFGSHAQPAHWTLGDYTWNQSLVIDRPGGTATQLRSVGAGVDLQTGSIESGMLTLEFYYDPHEPAGADVLNPANVWRSLVSPEVRNTVPLDPTKLVRPGDTRFWLSDFTGFTGGQWYAGKETVNFGSYSSTDGWADADGRGLYESQREWFGPRGAQARAFGGVVELTSWPDSWKGREIRVWAAASQMHRGVLTALSSGPRGSECYEVFRGFVSDLSIDDSRCSIVFDCDSLVQVLERTVLGRGRTYQAGPSDGGFGWVSIEENGPRYITVSHTTSVSEWPSDRLTIDVWSALGVGDTVRSAPQLASLIQSYIAGHYTYNDGSGTNYLISTVEARTDDGGKPYLRFTWGQYDHNIPGITPSGTFRIHGDEAQSLWPAFGVDGLVSIQGSGTRRAGVEMVTWDSPDPMPYYYVGGSGWLYYRGAIDSDPVDGFQFKSGDPPDLQGTIRSSGSIDGVYAMLGDATIAEVAFRQPPLAGDEFGALYSVGVGGRFLYRAKVLRYGACGAKAADWVIPFDEKDGHGSRIQAGLGFDGHQLFDAARYMMCSNGDRRAPVSAYNVMPDGFGAAIPADYIDHPSWDALQREIGAESTGWWIPEPKSARSILELIARNLGLFVHEKNTGEGIRIALSRALSPPLQQVSVASIDGDWTFSVEEAPRVTRSESRILNQVEVKYSWDPLGEEWLGRDITHVDANSVARYGPTQPFVVELPWISNLSDARVLVSPVAQGLLSLWGRPHNEYVVPLYNPAALALEAMDVVQVTLPFVPDWVSGGFGVASRYARITSIDKNFGMADPSEPFAMATMWPQSERFRYAPLIPSLRLWYAISGAEYAVRPDANSGGFADPDDDRNDAEWWESAADDSWFIYGYLPYADSEANEQNRSVSAIDIASDPPTITLSSALTGALASDIGKVVLSFRDFDTSGLASSQEEYVFFCQSPDLSSTVNTYKLTRADATTIEGVRWR